MRHLVAKNWCKSKIPHPENLKFSSGELLVFPFLIQDLGGHPGTPSWRQDWLNCDIEVEGLSTIFFIESCSRMMTIFVKLRIILNFKKISWKMLTSYNDKDSGRNWIDLFSALSIIGARYVRRAFKGRYFVENLNWGSLSGMKQFTWTSHCLKCQTGKSSSYLNHMLHLHQKLGWLWLDI